VGVVARWGEKFLVGAGQGGGRAVVACVKERWGVEGRALWWRERVCVVPESLERGAAPQMRGRLSVCGGETACRLESERQPLVGGIGALKWCWGGLRQTVRECVMF